MTTIAVLSFFVLLSVAAESGVEPPVKAASTAANGIDCVPKIGIGINPKHSDECKRMTEPRLWRGLWRNAFEGSQFCSEPAVTCSYSLAQPTVWLDSSYRWPVEFKEMARRGELFEVEFIGRRTVYPGMHGHMGVFDHKIVVDRLISMRPIAEQPRLKERVSKR